MTLLTTLRQTLGNDDIGSVGPGIFTYIDHTNQPKVGISSIHGSHGKFRETRCPKTCLKNM